MRSVLSAVFVVVVLATATVGGAMETVEQQTYAYFYFMQGQPEDARALVPSHVDYWHAKRLEGYRGGPFADHSGGMILFCAPSEARAQELVAGDPFVQGGVIGESWLKAWRVE